MATRIDFLLQFSNIRQGPVRVRVIKPITHDPHIRQIEADIVQGDFQAVPVLFEQGAGFHRRRLSTF